MSILAHGGATHAATRLRVFLTHTDDELLHAFPPDVLTDLGTHASLVRNMTAHVLEGEDLARHAAGCDVIVAHRSSPGRATTFAAASGLVAFLRAAVDTSTIDVQAASTHGILVTRVTPGYADAVAELGLGMMIDLARGLSRRWPSGTVGRASRPILGRQLRGKTVGVVGYGRIGRRLGAMCSCMGMDVVAHDPSIEDAGAGAAMLDFHALLARADFVVCLAAATPDTHDLFDAAAFAAMRPGSVFINLSRGALVDEDALEASLDAGHLDGAGLDVGRAPDELPSARFLSRADVVATPHVGGVTAEARRHQAMCVLDQVKALARGVMPEGALNREAAHRLRRLGL